VRVIAIDDNVRDGGDVKVIASLDGQRVNVVRGPISIEGGERFSEDLSITSPFMIPGETNFPLPDGTITGKGTLGGLSTISDAFASYIDPVRGQMPGFDPRINDYDYRFSLSNTTTRAVVATKDADSLTGYSIAVKSESDATFSVGLVNGSQPGVGTLKGAIDASAPSTKYTQATIVFDGLVSVGDVYTVSLVTSGGPFNVSYTANLADGLTLFKVTEKLAGLINPSFGGTQAIGKSLTIAGGANFSVTVTGGLTRVSGTPAALNPADEAALGWKLVEIAIPQLAAGATYSVKIGGTIYSYLSTAEDTWQDAVKGLSRAIDLHADRLYHAAVKYDTVVFTSSLGATVLPANAGYYFAPLNANLAVVESEQVDVLNLRNGNSPSNDVGFMTSDRVYGFGMGGDVTIGSTFINGGITYHNIESFDLQLGSGNDTLNILNTGPGVLKVSGGKGTDTFNIDSISGQTILNTGDGDLSTADGADIINVGATRQMADEIASLLWVYGDDGSDTLNVKDSLDTRDSAMVLTNTSITGLGMGVLAEQQLLSVRAIGGSYTLGAAGHTSTVLAYNASAATVEAALNGMFGVAAGTIRVSTNADGYLVTFGGTLSGTNVASLFWDQTVGATNTLVAAAESSVEVRVTQKASGTTTPTFTSNVQTVSLSGATGTFKLRVLGKFTDAISVNATADTVLGLLQPILDPDNSDPTKSHTRNVAVSRYGTNLVITFQGKYGSAGIDAIDTTPASGFTGITAGSVRLLTRQSGIDYFGVEVVNADLGSGSDTVDVLGTSATTRIRTFGGDDIISVGFDATLIAGTLENQLTKLANTAVIGGTLDFVLGALTLDAGAGGNTLNVSDFADTNADTAVTLADSAVAGHEIAGLAPTTITYLAGGGAVDA
ncbi:MAG: hypothetical protein WCO67_19710, partial [Betaproteobacteria bacterium]